MGAKIVCVGISCMDIIIRDVDLTTPFESETKLAGQMLCGVGGDASNQALVLGKMGADVKILIGIGDDGLGSYIRSVFETAGVDAKGIHVTPGEPSCVNVVVIHPSGQRNFINAGMPASGDFEIDLDLLEGAKIVSLGSILVPPFTTQQSICRVVQRAKENGSIVCADVVCSPAHIRLEDVREALSFIDYLFPNEEEASLLTGETEPDKIAEILLGYGIQHVVMKIGRDGCLVYSEDGKMAVPAFPCEAVDTNGAGDNFAAGFILALSEDRGIEECCRFAAATAAVSIQSVGANTGVKSREQVETFLAAQKI